MNEAAGLLEVQRMLNRERLSIDVCAKGRTCFISHVGSIPKLVPGPWIGHREMLRAMALANLSPVQRRSLARAVLLDHGREFGVGRLGLEASASGLPLGGSSLWMHSRSVELSCLYTWALSPDAEARPCEWLLLRAQAEWALDTPASSVSAPGLSTLVEVAGPVLVLVEAGVVARQIADLVRGVLDVTAHVRFLPYLEDHEPDAPVVLWPHDALSSVSLSGASFPTVITVGADERTHTLVERWAAAQDRVEVVAAGCPARVDRTALAKFWRACGNPNVLLRGDSQWVAQGRAWLRDLGAHVEIHQPGTQLGLF